MVSGEPCDGLASWCLKSSDTTGAPVAEFSKRVQSEVTDRIMGEKALGSTR
jgi:hypothetical protein